jgi:N-methylhydantoinase A
LKDHNRSALFGGVDIGGTFTDAVVISPAGGIGSGKHRSTSDLVTGFIAALEQAARGAGLASLDDALSQMHLLVHGSTVATNVAVERRGARVALVTTRGHGDNLKMMLGHGYSAGLPPEMLANPPLLYKPAPLVGESLIFEVNERIDSGGKVVAALREHEVREIADKAKEAGAESVAVSFLWSIRNPTHEQLARDVLAEALPGIPVSLSHDLAPRIGEYERTVAAVLDAYVAPACRDYLAALEQRVRDRGFAGRLVISQATGGGVTAEEARTRPLYMIGSGPAAGIVGAAAIAKEREIKNLIATDMGGTSFDVGIIADGFTVQSAAQVIDQYEYFVPAVELKSIGSGGGSIVAIRGGRLTVGPESAGASPGPVAYGRGGDRPTVTDCAAVLGYLPDELLGGELTLDKDAARAALETEGRDSGLAAIDLAAGAMRVVSGAMSDLIRQVTVARGLDPREFTILAYGGAGPLTVGRYGSELGVARAIIPHGGIAGVWSAFGASISDIVRVYEKFVTLATPFGVDELAKIVDDMEATVREDFLELPSVEIEWFAEMKYIGQINDVTVPIPTPAFRDAEAIEDAFRRRYQALYGTAAALKSGAPIAMTALKAIALSPTGARGTVADVRRAAAEDNGARSVAEPSGSRNIYWDDLGFTDTPTYDGEALTPAATVAGPAVIDANFSTMVVHPGQVAEVDELGNIVLTFHADPSARPTMRPSAAPSKEAPR